MRNPVERMNPTEIDLQTHPLLVLCRLRRGCKETMNFEFSRYLNRSRTERDDRKIESYRTVFFAPGSSITNEWVVSQLEGLAPGEELALHSRVWCGDQCFHIPMIDFETRLEAAAKAIALPDAQQRTLVLFNSGTSFHGYCTELLDSRGWIQFMGCLLLANQPGEQPIVDQRWVGHRLRAGYGSLRWSCNTAKYRAYPTLVWDKSGS
jgi:hypothetical protein